MDDISIDRLVLDVPGLTPAEAEELAKQVGKGLAAATAKPGTFTKISVDLGETATSGNVPRLANAIVDSLLGQIG
jgi:hypothetical protein